METITEITVKKQDIDGLGHVNNKVYVEYLEDGRIDWFNEIGYSYSELWEDHLTTVVLKMEITLLKEAVFGDVLKVKTSPHRLGNTSLDVKQEIYNQKDQMITEAIITCVMFNMKKRNKIPVIPGIAKHFK